MIGNIIIIIIIIIMTTVIIIIKTIKALGTIMIKDNNRTNNLINNKQNINIQLGRADI